MNPNWSLWIFNFLLNVSVCEWYFCKKDSFRLFPEFLNTWDRVSIALGPRKSTWLVIKVCGYIFLSSDHCFLVLPQRNWCQPDFPPSLWVGQWELCVWISIVSFRYVFMLTYFYHFFSEKYCAILIYRFQFLNFRFVFLHYFLDYVVPFASLYANIFDSLYLAHCVRDLYLVH